MKKTMLVATFLAVGAGSAGVSALDGVSMQGSDTLKDFTLSVITATACPAAVGINYVGGGSGPGETNLIASSNAATAIQTVAPMSRFLGSPAVCSAKDASKAESIAFAADGLAITVSKSHIACDPNAATGTTCTAAPPTGLKSSGTINGYVLGANSGTTQVQGWRDVLRLIYLGLPQTAGKDPDGTTAAGKALRDCNSSVRQGLVNNWGNLFENACAGGSCTQLSHAWRRDLLSGTTDVFRELINAKLYPFCNARFSTDATTNPDLYPSTGVLSTGAPLFDDPYQDFDPIRRACVGGANGQGGALPAAVTDPNTGAQTQPDFPASPAEQVCSIRGTLGLVIPVRPPVFTGQSTTELYPTKPCLRGNLVFGPAPKVPGTSKSTLCPNGDVTLGNVAADYSAVTGIITNSSNICLIPASDDNDPRCINGKNNFNTAIDPPLGAVPTAVRDGRIFNLHQYTAGGTYRSDSELGTARNVVGNFSRIHTTRTLIATAPTCPGTGGSKRCCDQDDATSQIGCLAEADQCSIGFAGGESAGQVLQTSAGAETAFAASINNIRNDQSCIVTALYPLSRKVYLGSVVGFENVTGQELGLAKCFAGAANNFTGLLAAKNLFPLPTGPVCQDFANEACSTNNTASDACANNQPGIPTAH